ncbi:hypothetical protein EI555_002308, partial [Monodon monoceros]
MTSSLTALEMLSHRERPFPGPRGRPGTAEKRGHHWPHATGGDVPDLPGALLTGLLTPRTLGMENAQLPPRHPIAQEEGVDSQGERQQVMARKPYVLSERPSCPAGFSLCVAAGLI